MFFLYVVTMPTLNKICICMYLYLMVAGYPPMYSVYVGQLLVAGRDFHTGTGHAQKRVVCGQLALAKLPR